MSEIEQILQTIREQRHYLQQLQLRQSNLWDKLNDLKKEIKSRKEHISNLVRLAEETSKNEV